MFAGERFDPTHAGDAYCQSGTHLATTTASVTTTWALSCTSFCISASTSNFEHLRPLLSPDHTMPLSLAAMNGANTMTISTTGQILPPLNVYASRSSGQDLCCTERPNVNSKTSVSPNQIRPTYRH